MQKFIRFLIPIMLLLSPLNGMAAPLFTAPVATSFSTAVPITAQSVLQLQGSDTDGTPLTYAVVGAPSHGALTNLNTATGALVYTPTAGYTGSDSFTYTVTSGGDTTAAATVTLAVTAAKTQVVDALINPDGSPRVGKVSFFLTQVSSSPSGIIPAKASVSAVLNSSGQFSVSLYPSRAVSPAQYYQVWFDDAVRGKTEMIGIYDIPAATAAISLSGHRITDAALSAQFTFASKAEVDALTQAVAAATTAQLFPLLTNGKHIIWNGTTFANSLISESAGTVTVTGNQTVTGTVTATGGYVGITNSAIPSTLSGKTLNDPIISGGTATGTSLQNPIISNPTYSGGGTFGGNLAVNGNLSVTGTLSGNGSGLTGVIAAGTGGGTSSTGAVSVIANSDGTGTDGVIEMMNGSPAVARLRVNNDGTTDLLGGLPAYTKAGLPAPGSPGRLVRLTDNLRGIWRDTGTDWVSLTGRANLADWGASGARTTATTSTVATTTTAGVTSGATTMAVASASGLSSGTIIRITGAGVSGGEHLARVTNVATLTITFYPASYTTVSSGARVQVADTSVKTTPTASITAGATSFTATSGATFSAGHGIYIAGAGASGAPYIGSITNISGSVFTITPATSTTVTSNAIVMHDDTAAIQAAINDLAPLKLVTLFAPDGIYNANGPLQTACAGQTARIIMPCLSETVEEYSLEIVGASRPTLGFSTVGNITIQSKGTIFTTHLGGGSMIGGDGTLAGGFSYVSVAFRNLTFRSHDHPKVTGINGDKWTKLVLENTVVDTGTQTIYQTEPTTNTAAGVRCPSDANGGVCLINNSLMTGY